VVGVPNNGKTTVTTTVQGQSPGEPPLPPQPVDTTWTPPRGKGKAPKELICFLKAVIDIAEYLLDKVEE
jgi:hypothetical protein